MTWSFSSATFYWVYASGYVTSLPKGSMRSGLAPMAVKDVLILWYRQQLLKLRRQCVLFISGNSR